MPDATAVQIRQLTSDDIDLMHDVLTLFGEAFEEPEIYDDARPEAGYLKRLLAGPSFIALAALESGRVIGALAAYELQKFEQERSEIYIYDLAVAATHRRRGIATKLIAAMGTIAAERGAWVMFIQADGDDEPAVALYEKLGEREEVAHFDIGVPRR